jgi:hypothetical protein
MVCIMSHGTMVDSSTDLSTVIYAADGIPVSLLFWQQISSILFDNVFFINGHILCK